MKKELNNGDEQRTIDPNKKEIWQKQESPKLWRIRRKRKSLQRIQSSIMRGNEKLFEGLKQHLYNVIDEVNQCCGMKANER